MSKLETNIIAPSTGTTLTLGESGDSIVVPSGVTITNNGTQTGFGGTNSPAWSVTTNGSAQSVSVNSRTIVQFNTENFDLGSVFNTSTYKATPTSGKYLLTANVTMKPTAAGVYQMWIQIMKNTTTIAKQGILLSSAEYETNVAQSFDCSVTATANGTDTFHVEVYYYNGTAQVMAIDGNAPQNFSGIKIIE